MNTASCAPIAAESGSPPGITQIRSSDIRRGSPSKILIKRFAVVGEPISAHYWVLHELQGDRVLAQLGVCMDFFEVVPMGNLL
eukprot:COSAG02_NODE_387_length_23294_cov_52.630610_12_plen_83_part_00